MSTAKPNIYQILRKRYPEAEYALLKEVRDGAGHSSSRSADYIVMNLWPSRGLSMHCIEQKIHRSDWLSELKKPAKANEIGQYCEYMWLLTTENVAKLEEIPENWGWMQIANNKIKVMKEAPKRETIPITRTFVAALLKRGCSKDGWTHYDQIQDKLNEKYEEGKNERRKQYDDVKERLDKVEKVCNEYEKVTGIKLIARYWTADARKIGEAVNFIKDNKTDKIKKNLLELESTAQHILASITAGLQALKQAEPVENSNEN